MNALVVIDVQESFRQRANWSEVSNPGIVGDVNRLVVAARERGEPVVWILHSEPGSGGVFDPASGHVVLQPGLVPLPGEPLLTKTTRNAFTSTELGRLLQRGGVTGLTIAGIQTEQCCETTARLAADLGFDVDFVTEATATFPIVRPDTGAVLGTDAIIERTEFALAGRFARIRTLDEAVAGAA
ncbi:Isochorismatase hydrolase OS=Tsukamurella paurometabola (strain ATCC 8368 / DSM / CCUG 35730/ CIP 100753 / JCM 10117 / KCTC 9821 / NBRC 16120 / NCIMB 702349/ NCTC 13040) OX=521096 GN=Tpau_0338 PE=4 SV=1 [Tsukamurella paurometabola]|uniref:Isochorismatase hydrolase n=1 Tax=Tsukamurella paurometabola (strain ATCC 8368 / DSM 20162 / CCUG 35730 / CIP 100753 / JCM 10117 / KCTC 9821 / NBRC 16120 / NCIMB 702349 / NCTC 13040) TaxID=521096 RepID=D5URC8_TSUPD|nr:isochorismatase family protein [Tsukamurella paurometabola]ADG76981.1 isochorismatase hydrolase [Tsukamurella paurometabola DSM 20162]SUP42365.1 putative hydrolase [Tsukamurella paurometabola]